MPARQFPRCVLFLRRSELAPKELILRFQRDNFAPTGFEIPYARQIIPRHEETRFLFARLTFSSEPKKWKQDKSTDASVPPIEQLMASPGSQFIASLLSFFLPLEHIF